LGGKIKIGVPEASGYSVTTTVKHAGVSGLGDVVNYGLGYAFTVLLTRVLSSSYYGLFALTTTITSLVAILARFGLENTVMRYTALYRARTNPDALRGLLRFVNVLGGICGALSILLLVAFSATLETVLKKPGLGSLLRWSAIIVGPLTVIPIWLGTLQGLHRISERVWLEYILQPILKLVLVGAGFLLGFRLKGAVVGVAMASLVYALVTWVTLNRVRQTTIAPGPRVYEASEWLTFAVPMLLDSLFFVPLVGSLDVLVLGYFRSAEEVGIYSAVLRLAPLTALPLFAFNRAFAPTIAELYGKGDRMQLAHSFKLITRWVFTFSLPIFIVFVVGGSTILSLFGPEFVAGALVLSTLALGRLIDAGTGPVGYMLVMTGHPRLNLLNSALLLGFDLGLSIWLVPSYGLIGMAVAQAVSVAAVNLLRVLEVRKILDMTPYDRGFLKPLFSGVVSLGLFAALRYWQAGNASYLSMLVITVLVIAVYFGMVLGLGLAREDKAVLSHLFRRLSVAGYRR
jgi:O-antigen/teichoic acid export membrane protein